MINDTYQIVMKTMMGKKYGQLTLYENERCLSGNFNILGHNHEINNGVLVDGKCRFSGKLMTPVRNIDYMAEGSVDEHSVELVIHTDRYKMSLFGKNENTKRGER